MTILSRSMVPKIPIRVDGVLRPVGVPVAVSEPRATRLEGGRKAEAAACNVTYPSAPEEGAEEDAEE
ncbi:hypothetical protein [Paenirhodobacter populi]|uniref:hypothetical protein n=1 Tax=Paenirhodobacter populi TaxID=2306993 RepID=UPI000FE38754|nr:hypothetical protein [Sinirhodobacter populi]RWR09711.1 hypothetical protein D2T32_05035 [Sinirhodobacter populi]